jgi:hypothetical protein
MTTLAAWVGHDPHGITSLYIVSDSRITWPDGQQWNLGPKCFLIPGRPEALGYCGDVQFTVQVVSQVCAQLSSGTLIETAAPDERFRAIVDHVRAAHASFPTSVRGPFVILYAVRIGENFRKAGNNNAAFSLFRLAWDPAAGWSDEQVMLPQKSGIVRVEGTGAAALRATLDVWSKSDAGGTSAAVFSAFCDALKGGIDPSTGGPPQLVGIYRSGPARQFGIVWDGERFLAGAKVQSAGQVAWHNDLFEVWDGATLARRKGADRLVRPRNARRSGRQDA